jgi:Arc/MetJ family transcription regulator
MNIRARRTNHNTRSRPQSSKPAQGLKTKLLAKRSKIPKAELGRGQLNTLRIQFLLYYLSVSRTNIEINDALIQNARKLTRLRTKRAIDDRALELLVRMQSRKGVLRNKENKNYGYSHQYRPEA